jgi:hypothetical protein
MKKLSRLAVLVGLLAGAIWGAVPRPAHAVYPYCTLLQGKRCVTPGLTYACMWPSPPGAAGVCECQDDSFVWVCT